MKISPKTAHTILKAAGRKAMVKIEAEGWYVYLPGGFDAFLRLPIQTEGVEYPTFVSASALAGALELQGKTEFPRILQYVDPGRAVGENRAPFAIAELAFPGGIQAKVTLGYESEFSKTYKAPPAIEVWQKYRLYWQAAEAIVRGMEFCTDDAALIPQLQAVFYRPQYAKVVATNTHVLFSSAHTTEVVLEAGKDKANQDAPFPTAVCKVMAKLKVDTIDVEGFDHSERRYTFTLEAPKKAPADYVKETFEVYLDSRAQGLPPAAEEVENMAFDFSKTPKNAYVLDIEDTYDSVLEAFSRLQKYAATAGFTTWTPKVAKKHHAVKFLQVPDGDSLKVQFLAEDTEEVQEVRPCLSWNASGDYLPIGMSLDYLLEAIKSLGFPPTSDAVIRLRMLNGSTPAALYATAPSNWHTRCVVMPRDMARTH